MLKQTTSNKRVQFKGTPTKEAFMKDLRGRVNKYFEEKGVSQYANGEMWFKTVFAVAAWAGAYWLLMSGQYNGHPVWLFLGYLLLGFVNIFIAFNIVHDAGHDAISPKKWVNKVLCYSMDFIGGNHYLFRQVHGSHHGFVNIHGIDATLETHGLFRFSPDEPWLPRHRYQHIYTFILYSLAMLQWVTIKDFKWFFTEANIGNVKNIKHPAKEYVALFVGKAVYYTLTLVLPLIYLPFAWYTIVGAWVFMHILPGLTFALIFQVTHIYEGTTFPLPDDEGNIDNNYALHVIETTADFSVRSRIGSWLMGGINIHVIHHIFPRVCHVHYPELTAILRECCADYGIQYQENKTFPQAIKRHYQILKELSKPDAVMPRVGASAYL